MSKQKDESIYRKGWNDGFAKGAAAARFQLEAENAHLRSELEFVGTAAYLYGRGDLEAENAKLRELVRDLYRDLAAILGDGLWMEPYESRMMELGVDA